MTLQEALRKILDFIERHNKQDAEASVAEAAQIVEYYLSKVEA